MAEFAIRSQTGGFKLCPLQGFQFINHKAQQLLTSIELQSPFDVMAFDIWRPGDIPSSVRAGSSKTARMLLTGMDVLTAFAGAAASESATSEEVSRVLFQHFISTFGLPKLIVIDAGSEFAGTLISMCTVLEIKYHAVSKENHKAVQVKPLHLNKVQRTHAIDCETIDDWLIGTTFAVYAWNSAPVYGTDIIRSFAAIGREFPFPLDLKIHPVINVDNMNIGKQTLSHIEGSFPLLFKQREILKALTEERQQHHRNLRNKGKKPSVFSVGDLVVVRKQVQTSSEKGPSKATTAGKRPILGTRSTFRQHLSHSTPPF